ncbi:MAG: YbaB/EbfC family nucleoid-associated protein [Coriobacteriales bacterium]|jgi:DNA-binding YbaB/EbfC family protein|nr:YbaB/EbfC family nucleoid-associated protein [Coriobacteriales bacterium]
MAQMNMQKMMKEARKMQEEVARAQEEVVLLEAEGTAGGGAVKAVASGNGRIKQLDISPDAIDPDDAEMLEDLVLSAVNEALGNVSELAQMRMDAATGGFNLPGF